LPQDQPVLVGKTEHHVTVRVGPWTFALWIQKDSHFPKVEHVIPATGSAQTTLELAPADAEFYLDNLNRLPSKPDDHAVTLDLTSTIAVRAKSNEAQWPTELILTNSRRTGEDVRISIDRRFLARAAATKLLQIYLYGDKGALLAQDASRQYLWMPLGPDNVVQPSADCLRIESPQGAPPAAARVRPVPPATVPMNTSPTVPTPAATPETNNASQPQPVRRRRASKTASALDQALAVREQLRGAMTGTKELIRALKTEKRSQKSLKLALDSLKQLQAVA
jgi:hypothetical protein